MMQGILAVPSLSPAFQINLLSSLYHSWKITDMQDYMEVAYLGESPRLFHHCESDRVCLLSR